MPSKDFELIKEIGRGAFGSVLKVMRSIDSKYYAVKRINIQGLKRSELKSTVNEVRLLASLKHSNVVRYYESFTSKRNLYLVMELVEGGDLDAKIKTQYKKRKYFSESFILDIANQVLKGLAYLHNKNIIHRDIKPANILLTNDGKAKITDLNISIFTKNGFAKTLVGTPYYIAPEVWKSLPYTEKVDVWAFGCLIYEMCALKRPFRAKAYLALCKKVCDGHYRRIPLKYSHKMQVIVDTSLNKFPQRRPSVKRLLAHSFVKENKSIVKYQKKKELLPTILVPLDVKNLNRMLPQPSYDRLPQINKRKVERPLTGV